MRVIIVESSSPWDLMHGTSEKDSLEQICKMMGHNVASFFVKSKFEFEAVFEYISSINSFSDDEQEPLCIHISCHGNKDGLAIGNDFLNWENTVECMAPVLSMENYGEPIFLAVSACGTDKQLLTKYIRERKDLKIIPPNYIFFINQELVSWKDALLNWTILYHQIDNLDITNKMDFQDLLSRIAGSGLGSLRYYRWDVKDRRYKFFQRQQQLV